jgi:hypothetical protein
MRKIWFIYIWIFCLLFGCTQTKQDEKEYFVKQCSFVCDYPFDEISKYAVVCRVWGLLKYYHPNVTAGKFDWDNVLLDCLDNIESVSSPASVNSAIRNMIQTAGKYKISKQDFHDSLNMNVNLCWINDSFLDEDIRLTLYKISSNTVVQPSYYACAIDSLPNMFCNEKKYQMDKLYNVKYRLLSLFRYWNVIYYFSPYKYLMDKSWDLRLTEFIPKFIFSDIQTYNKTVTEMSVTVNDGHGYTSTMPYIDFMPLPVEQIVKIDNNIVIRIPLTKNLLKKGDIILKIGIEDIDEFQSRLSTFIPSSNEYFTQYMINLHIYQQILNGTEMTVLRHGQKIKVNTNVNFDNNVPDKISAYRKISDSIGYANLSILQSYELYQMFRTFKDTKKIILDLRNYPRNNVSADIIAHISQKEEHDYLKFTCPDITHPGAFHWINSKETIIYRRKENLSYYNGKIIVLISDATISAAETTAVMYRTAINATLIGRPTAGANGNISRLFLPGEVIICFSGLGAYYPDQTEIQRKGVIPDIEVYPDMQSIMEGKDEILEAAISYID